MRALLAISLLVAGTAQAELKSGWAFLAAEHKDFPAAKCKVYAKASPAPFMAVLADSFGTKKACLKNFMAASKGKPTVWQYYLGNGAGRRKKLYSYEFLHDLSANEYNTKLCSGDAKTKKAVVDQAKRLKKRCESVAHAQAECRLAHELESQFTECAEKRMTEYLELAGWPNERIVHNPVNIGPFQGRGRAGILERHWVLNRPAEKDYHLGIDGACADHCGGCGLVGSRVQDNQIVQWRADNNNRAGAFFSLWCSEHQGLFKANIGKHPEPRRRTIRVTQSSFITGNRLIGLDIGKQKKAKKEHYTKGCDVVKKFSGGNLAKESEYSGFVAVMMEPLESAKLVQPNGKTHSLRYTGEGNPFNGHIRHHYRHTQQFFKFPDNMILKGKQGGKVTCYKLFKAGDRHE